MSQMFYLCFNINLVVSVSPILDKVFDNVLRIGCRKYELGVVGLFCDV